MSLLYERFNNSEFLKSRFEKDFPFIYLGDIVTVSSRWAGGSKNTDEGKNGNVVSIQHNLESMFNRDYLDVTVIPESGFNGRFNTYLYALDLKTRKPKNAELFKKGKIIYLDDRIEVVGENHPNFGATGKVVEISGYNGTINLVANDESVSERFNNFEIMHAKEIEVKTQRALSDTDLFSEFLAIIKEKHPKFPNIDVILSKEIKHAFESSVRQTAIKEVTSQSDYVNQIDELNKELKFLADSSSVEMVERFPPNALFKID